MPLTDNEKISIMLEEYRALYSLLTYRFSSIEKRIATSGILMSAVLGLFPTIPTESKIIFLIGAPMALIYILRSTLLHVRSLEDYFRKIEFVEKRINQIAKQELLQFQRSHPSKKLPGGRGSHELINFILIMSIGILLSCGYLFSTQDALQSNVYWYGAYVLATGVYLILFRIRFNSYEYAPEDGTENINTPLEESDDISEEL